MSKKLFVEIKDITYTVEAIDGKGIVWLEGLNEPIEINNPLLGRMYKAHTLPCPDCMTTGEEKKGVFTLKCRTCGGKGQLIGAEDE